MVYREDLALVSGSREGLNEKLKAWKGVLKSKTLKVNVKKTKMMISSEKARKVRTQESFLVQFAEKMSNSIFCQFSNVR